MLIHTLLIAAMIAGGHGSQRTRPVRVLSYDPLAMEAFQKEQQSKLATEEKEPAATPEEKPGSKPGQSGPSYVNISGNFGGVFYVTGVGSGTTQSETNIVNIVTNRPLTFITNSFKPLALGNTSESSMGSITYSMALYQGNSSHVGAMIAGPVSGTDAGFNGQTLTVNAGQIPGNGGLVIVISRTLTLTGQATGACTLVGTGYIGVTIN